MSVENENVFRALGDQPLLADKQWWCAFGIHTWLPWKDPIQRRRGAYDYTEQYRACGYCNKFQRRELSRD
jgi:hypothetical protein